MVSGSIPGKVFLSCNINPMKITATAPVAPDIIPGLPPKIEVIKANTKAAYNPVKGENPGIKANAMASGTNAKATVRPDKTSVL